MLLASVSALESNTASKDTINDCFSCGVFVPPVPEFSWGWLLVADGGTDWDWFGTPKAPPHPATSLFSLFPCVRVACEWPRIKEREEVPGAWEEPSRTASWKPRRQYRGSSQDALRTRGGAGSRTVAVFWLQVFTWLRKAAMDPQKNNHSVTSNQDTVGLSIHSTSDTLVVTSYLLLVLFFGLWVWRDPCAGVALPRRDLAST